MESEEQMLKCRFRRLEYTELTLQLIEGITTMVEAWLLQIGGDNSRDFSREGDKTLNTAHVL